MNKPLRIVFMGTPDFAVSSLDILMKNGYDIAGVITSPDKPAGRGQKIRLSAVKQYAIANNLFVMQPESLKDAGFNNQLDKLEANLQIIVAFRMLPEIVWAKPLFGTFNLHASCLPHYRGAAPINHVIINGEKETGVTTFFLKHKIDTGDIIFREKAKIGDDETAGELHDRLMTLGAELVLKTVRAIENNNITLLHQATLCQDINKIKPAPKISKDDCRIDWKSSIDKIHNHIRGLSPYPGAWTEITSPEGKTYQLKIFRSEKERILHNCAIGDIIVNEKESIKIAVKNGFIKLFNLQMPGKKRMEINDFLRGTKINSLWKIL